MAAPKPQNQFVQQAGIIALSMLIARVMGFFYRLPLTGLLGDEGNAWYSMAYAVYTVILVVVASALPNTVSKLVSERMALKQYRNAHGIFQTTLTLSIITGVVAAVGLWFLARPLANLLGSPQSVAGMRALAPAFLLVGPMGAFRGYFLGMNGAFTVGASQIMEQVFNVSVSLFLAFLLFDAERLHRSVAGAAAGTGVGVVAGLLVLIAVYAVVQKQFNKRMVKDLRPPFETERSQLKILSAMLAPVVISMVLINLTTPLDLAMANSRLAATGAFSTQEIDILVGQFSVKYIVLIGLPVALAAAFSQAVIPDISASSILRNNARVRESVNTAMRLAMVIAVPAAVGLAVLADPILALLFPSFPEGGALLRWGSIAVVFMGINQILTAALQGAGRPAMPVVAAAVGLLVKIPVNYFLMGVPGINIIGAAISTILCFVIAMGMNMYFLYYTKRIWPRIGVTLVKPVVAAAIMGVASWGLHRGLGILLPARTTTVSTLVLAVAIYIAAMTVMRGLEPGDIDFLPLPGRFKRWLLY